MKKFITLIIAAVLAVQCTAFAENNGYVFRTKSSLADYLNLDFESRYPGSPVKEVRISSGNGAYKIMSENNETFLRLENYSDDKDCYFYFDLPKFADGEVAIEFDARISKIKYMQMPTVVGISDSKKSNVDLTRVVLSSSGTLSLDSSNVTKLTSSAGTKDWTKFIIYVNTESDTARLFVNNDASVPTKTLTGIYKVSALRFLLRGAGQKVDINNFSVYACRLNEDSLSEPSAEEAKGLALPVRYLRSAAGVPFARGITVDAQETEGAWKTAKYYTAQKLSGKSSSEAKFKMLHDGENLYIFAKVTDKTVYSDANSVKKSDRIVLYFDGKDDNCAYYDGNDSYIVITSDKRCETADADGIEFETSVGADGWTCEISVGLESLGIDINGTKNPGFDFEFIDYYKSADYSVSHIWRGSDRNVYSTASFGEMVLE